MIIGKKSALKGFSFFIWTTCLILMMVGAIVSGSWFIIVPSLILAGINVYLIAAIYRYFVRKSESVYKNRRW